MTSLSKKGKKLRKRKALKNPGARGGRLAKSKVDPRWAEIPGKRFYNQKRQRYNRIK